MSTLLCLNSALHHSHRLYHQQLLNIENVTENHRVEYLWRNAGVLPVSGQATVALRKGIQQHIHTVMKTAYMCLHIDVLPRLLPIVLVTFCPMHVVTAIDIF